MQSREGVITEREESGKKRGGGNDAAAAAAAVAMMNGRVHDLDAETEGRKRNNKLRRLNTN